MPITVTCLTCQSSFQTKREHAGKRAKCPKCQSAITIPHAKPAPPASISVADTPKQPSLDPEARAKQILGAFQSGIEPIELTTSYHVAILLIVCVMVILPLVYLGIIGGGLYVLYYHATNNIDLCAGLRGRAVVWGFLLGYVSPLVGGGIALLFMIKPLFARPPKSPPPLSLSRDQEPVLFAFVDQICQIVGAPTPSRIDMDAQVNASASFRRGWMSMFGSDLVLTIGLPLVACLDLRQFAGVLAHEFGHFTQGAGMRLTYVVRMISWWFTRVVYERDEWDVRLAQWSKDVDLRIGFFLLIARFFVWLSRRILWVLMMIGNGFSGLLLRQMEYDADRHSTRLVGSDVTISLSRELVVLEVATQGAYTDLGEFYREGRLSDDFPRLIASNVSQIPEESDKEIDQYIFSTKAGLFDTHPSAWDRIQNAEEENEPGVFHLNIPASNLFLDFSSQCKRATLAYYREIFGEQFDTTQVHPVELLLERQNVEQDAVKSLERFLLGTFSALRPFQLPSFQFEAPSAPGQCAKELKSARQEMTRLRLDYQEASKVFDTADTTLIETLQTDAMLAASVKPSLLDMEFKNAATALHARKNAVGTQLQAKTTLDPFDEAAATRLINGLQLLHVPKVAARIEQAETLKQEAADVLPILAVIVRMHDRLVAVRNRRATMGVLLGALEKGEESESLFRAIRTQMNELRSLVDTIRKEFLNHTYPLDHAKGPISVGEYALAEMPQSEDVGGIFGSAESLLDNLFSLYVRLIARLTNSAERVEKTLGLKPIEVPDDQDESL